MSSQSSPKMLQTVTQLGPREQCCNQNVPPMPVIQIWLWNGNCTNCRNRIYDLSTLDMWHNQWEWFRSREYWLRVTGLKRLLIPMFYIVFQLQRMLISLQPDAKLRWGSDQNVAFWMDKCIYIKNSKLKIANMCLIPLDCVKIYMTMVKMVALDWT